MTTKPFYSYGNPVKIIMCAQKRDERTESCQLLVEKQKYKKNITRHVKRQSKVSE